MPSVASAGKNPSSLPILNTLMALCHGMPSGSVSFANIQILVKGGMTQMIGFDFRTELAKICPDYQIEEDNDGQIVIYTNLRDDGNDNYVSFEEDSA